jgi:hypothetical protein
MLLTLAREHRLFNLSGPPVADLTAHTKEHHMDAKKKWIAVGAASVLGLGLLAGGAAASANNMSVNDRSGERVGDGITSIDDRINESPVLVPSNSVSATSAVSAPSIASTTSPVSAQSAVSPVSAPSAVSPVSAQSVASPVSAASVASPVSPVSAVSPASPVSAPSAASPVSAPSAASPVSAQSAASPVSTD